MEKDSLQKVVCDNCGHVNSVKSGTDMLIACVECSDEFVWNRGEQQYYFDHGLNMPMRCQVCRVKRRQRLEELKNNELTLESENQ